MSQIAAETVRGTRPVDARRKKADFTRLGYPLFIFVNVMLLVRPGELFPGLLSLHLYELSMLMCLAMYWPRVLGALRPSRLRQTPITLCVVAMLPLLAMSLLWNGRADLFGDYVVEYIKIVLYYLLLVSAIDSVQRLRHFVLSLAVIISVVGAVALAHHLGIWTVPSIKTLVDKRSGMAEGMLFVMQTVKLERMLGVGIFADPNDLAQILGVGMVLAVYGLERSRYAITRLMWAMPILVMAAGIYYTKSRGGLLAMVAGLGMLFMARFGVKKAIILAVLTAPVLFVVFGGHQTRISTEDESAQARVQLWSDSLQALREHPAMGIGPGVMTEYAGQVSHNSFLQAFAETGFLGGLLFLAAYALALYGPLRLRRKGIEVTDPDLAKLTPVLVAATACYAMGMMSLTRNYVIPTYLILGLLTVYLRAVRTNPPKAPIACSFSLLGKSFALAVCFLVIMQVFVKVSVRWG